MADPAQTRNEHIPINISLWVHAAESFALIADIRLLLTIQSISTLSLLLLLLLLSFYDGA